MNTTLNTLIKIALVVLVVLILTGGVVWFLFFRSTTISTDTSTPTATFDGTSGDIPNTTTTQTGTSNGTQAIDTTTVASQKIFKINDGPVVGATLIQTLRPTTTVARYIRQDDGHVYDIPLGVSGAVPKVVSNITIPGGQRVVWVEGGQGAVLQYVDDASIVKTMYMGFPQATSSRTLGATRIQFFPDNVIDYAVSPDGKNIAYLLKTSVGSDGYISKTDGTGAKKMFSLPFNQLVITWPSLTTLLVHTKSSANVSGIAFSVDTKNGVTNLLVTGVGLTAIADSGFSNILYQIRGAELSTYVHNNKSGADFESLYAVYPERCIWSKQKTALAYCALPFEEVDSTYLDYWHQGGTEINDKLVTLNINTGESFSLVTPGLRVGGDAATILEMSLSVDERYLMYTTKGARNLWGVLLTQ